MVGVQDGRGREQQYYVALGGSSDHLLRCKDCRTLVTLAQLQRTGMCDCGTKRVTEVRTLSLWEWLRVRLGVIDFPYRAEFLREFPFPLWSR